MPQFRHIRLPAEAYRRRGVFFITICLRRRRQWFGVCRQGKMRLSIVGDICRTHLLGIPGHWDGVGLDTWVIMPDHLHIILVLRHHVPSGILQVVGGFKSGVARDVAARCPDIPVPFWQARFHDRRLRSRDDLLRARRYIAANPSRWKG